MTQPGAEPDLAQAYLIWSIRGFVSKIIKTFRWTNDSIEVTKKKLLDEHKQNVVQRIFWMEYIISGIPNLNNSDKSEFIRKRIVPFLMHRIEIMNIRIWLLINRIVVCSTRVIPVRNRIHSIDIPHERNNTRIVQRVQFICHWLI